MRKGTRTFQLISHHASVWRKEIMLSLASAGDIYMLWHELYYTKFSLICGPFCFSNVVTYFDFPQTLGRCQRPWGSMFWRWFLLVLQVVGRRLLQEFKAYLECAGISDVRCWPFSYVLFWSIDYYFFQGKFWERIPNGLKGFVIQFYFLL